MKIVVIDGQGGKMGGLIVRKIKEQKIKAELYAIGTNSTATAAMLRAGADFGATGENPVVVNLRDADVVIGPIGIISADAILGEVTEKMASAVGAAKARKVLIPVNSCNIYISGVGERPMSAYIDEAVKTVCALADDYVAL